MKIKKILLLAIYKITNIVNKKIYIGQTKNSIESRLAGHIWSSIHEKTKNIPLHNAIRRYGKENFKIELIEICSSKKELDEREQYWIEKLQTRDRSFGYNICKGGEGGCGGPYFSGHTHTEATKQQMSSDRSGDKNANYGNRWHHTKDMKYKYDGKNNPMFGKHHSDESKEKSRQKHLGKKAYSNLKLDRVIMLTPEDGEKLIKKDANWFEGNIHKQK